MLLTIEDGAFKGCENFVIKTTLPREEWPAGWADSWLDDAPVEIVEKEELEEDEEDNDKDKDKDKDDKENGRK